ncbi:cytochrome b6-f complex iron-sulfur subunit [Candidatus Kryptonium thompsonii]|mgnify:CR=1 FL=1|jgi:cytochrome b6-f complex iron-sulfur subunit|uniref:Cytochrome b6-f complex iron-sulfur subunit n=2 Tax=Candidatus Kryptonium thompsonii TaxID=1633631 RepID=A0A0P1LAH9_9BACT|nr:Rieske 2Fe-2S domain-containing protein [Candidatus Kryptonium thompsoni]CUS78237.1 cytochrome b6-f complex iron-sulfur subunit [Candidatus Kryptonium thompsoni]CUS81762.1 cytochrome b6-f complex iron-sulfur subunit [Candidatus Kryptonium thompsoni]CUS82335.1 cytochrome b6-f complex iron-sulfur subunit [Candidatus Kryptonium thompsoni]CUS87783.1 cytochrome b6-f complex iron-sulfur subunit [Candidatus Kryptonium thompsoni]CUS90927.1 cytochrome b6-f complex iron-sulfur subunit [Candidatus Kry
MSESLNQTTNQDVVQKDVKKKVIPRQDKPPENDTGLWKFNRRSFLTLTGWLGFLGFIFTSIIGAIRYMFPRVLYEPPTTFKAGYPDEYTVGEVSERFKDSQRVWIVREEDGFYALLAVCTHLGCTPRWLSSENKFKCPCHGSGFRKSGINFEGPAPRPLERVKITLAEDGQILIDKGITYRYEKGEWGKPGSFLPYRG